MKKRTYKQKFNKRYSQPVNQSNSLERISTLTGYKLKGLRTIFDKGRGAFYTNPESVRPHVKTPEQWGYARVYASIDPSSASYKIDRSHLRKS